jgi:hypothetical protein
LSGVGQMLAYSSAPAWLLDIKPCCTHAVCVAQFIYCYVRTGTHLTRSCHHDFADCTCFLQLMCYTHICMPAGCPALQDSGAFHVACPA